jgi:RNA polymerase sigma-70 factor (ECF subfamily)
LETLAEPVDCRNNRPLSDESGLLLRLVCRLPQHERVVVALRHFDGHSVHEIADMTRRPVGTVTKQLSRAHQRLRHWLEETPA